MTLPNIITHLIAWQAVMTQSETTCEDILEPLMMSPESPVYAAIWTLQDAYTRAVSELVGDDFEWLIWYRHENDMGKKALEARQNVSARMRKIKNLTDLSRLIHQSK